MHLKQLRHTYSASGPFTKQCERIPKFRGTGNLKSLYINWLEKASFTHDAAYSDSKDLSERTMLYKILENRA